MTSKQVLIGNLIEEGVLMSPVIVDAFKHIDRADFVSPGMEEEAYFNIPLPIGKGQTISQPMTVAFMLELLQPHYGHKILDVGSGSGWQAGLLAHIVSRNPDGNSGNARPGKVICAEVIPKLHDFCIENISKYNFITEGIVEVFCVNAAGGFPHEAPFDRIIAAASCDKIPQVWKEQLEPGGRIVAPVGSNLVLLQQKDKGTWEKKEYPGFAFVPFVEE